MQRAARLRRHPRRRAEGSGRHRRSAAKRRHREGRSRRRSVRSLPRHGQGPAAARTEITLFKSVGTAIEDLAAAMLVWQASRDQGRTRQSSRGDVETARHDSFGQNLRPDDPRGARRGARRRRRHRRLRVLSAVAAPSRLRGGARARRARAAAAPQKVALSVDADDAISPPIVEALKPDMLQLHGTETPERVAAVQNALRPAGDEGAADRRTPPISRRSGSMPVADRLLFDARAPRDATRPGGLGKPFDWHLLRQPRSRRCRSCCRAGSMPAMSPRRCASRARRGVDVSSGVERAPGEKDPRQDPRLHPRRARRPTATLAAQKIASSA